MTLTKTLRRAALCLLLFGTGTVSALAQTNNVPDAAANAKATDAKAKATDAKATATTNTKATDAAATDTVASLQPLSIAVFSYEKAFQSMAELAIVQEKVANLKQQYSDELKRTEDEFNKKYEDFLAQQSKLAPAIRNKRQAEIQQLLESNMAFKNEAQKTISATEAELLAPLKEKLQQTIADVAQDNGHNMVLNTDNSTIPYIDGIRITDITETIIQRLKK